MVIEHLKKVRMEGKFICLRFCDRKLLLLLILPLFFASILFVIPAWAATGQTESKDTILTAGNNKELAAILRLKDYHSPSIGKFAKKYVGRTIAFNGNISYMDYHGSYKTRYDFLIEVGDYSEEEGPFYGPHFVFRDKNAFDLHLKGTDIVRIGDNLRIVAKVESFNENTGLFLIVPVSCEAR
jgi:hypothetical protein